MACSDKARNCRTYAVCLVSCKRKGRIFWYGIIKNRRSFILLFVYGVLGVSLSQFTYFLTIQLSSAEVGTILQDLSPVFILMCTSVMRKSRPKLYEVATAYFLHLSVWDLLLPMAISVILPYPRRHFQQGFYVRYA